jgi:hypothetical protein
LLRVCRNYLNGGCIYFFVRRDAAGRQHELGAGTVG